MPVPGYTRSLLHIILLLLIIGCMTGCGRKNQNIPFKVNSQPEGAQVLFNMSGSWSQKNQDWLYLGHTPLRAIRLLNEDEVTGSGKVTLKVMHAGYYDQVKEWDGETFWAQIEQEGFVFWAPQLIPQPLAE